MTTETTKAVRSEHWIPVGREEALKERLADLGRRAAKLGVAAPVLTLTEETQRMVQENH